MSYKYKHGIAVMRCQPFHKGHEFVIDTILEECEYATVLLGSIQEHGTSRNPFNFSVRKKMLQNVFRNSTDYPRLKIMGIKDIVNDVDWVEHVLNIVNSTTEFPYNPDAYFCGTDYDGSWFKNSELNVRNLNRNNPEIPFVSGTMLREMFDYNDMRWKKLIDKSNHQTVEKYLEKLNQDFAL